MALKTAITFGLVNIPVRLNPVIKNNDTNFNYLHKKCLNRVSYIKYCPTCKKDVTTKDLIKGYEYTDDKYVTFDESDFDKLKTTDDKNIEIISFVNEDEIDPIYYEKSYYLNTDKKSKAFSLFKTALKKCGKVAVAKTVIGSKSYYAVLRFGENNIIMTTLYYEEEIVLDDVKVEEKYTEKEMDLALKLIESMEGEFTPEDYIDEYQDKVKNAIEKKIDGKEIKQAKSKKKVTVTNLMDALEKSLKRA
ncbi:MAG: Ku protein [Bacilli bacterium]|nr:Ku protein [Bacilli bacterium]